MKTILLLFILAPIQIFADNELIERKNLRFNSSNDYADRLDAQEKEIQQLLGRIEILEHNISRLQKHLDSLSQSTVNSQEAPKIDTVAQDSSIAADVFDVSSIKEIDSKVKSDTPSSNQGNIEKDKQLYDLALASLKDNKLNESEEKFAAFLKNYPNSSLLSNAYFWYGEVFYRRNMFDKAAINYLKGYKQSPQGVKASDSLLKLSLSLGELKKQQEACGILEKLETEFPTRSAISIKRAKDAKVKFGCKSSK